MDSKFYLGTNSFFRPGIVLFFIRDTKQAQSGVWNFRFKAVYLIGILDFTLFNGKDDEHEYFERIYLARSKTKEQYSDKLNFIFVELPKFNKSEQELETNEDRWLFCLKNLPRLTDRPEAVQGKIFEKLFKLLEINRMEDKEMEQYKKSILEYDDIKDVVECAREETREETREKTCEVIAKNMIYLRIDDRLIVQATGLSPEEIDRIKESL